MVLLTRGLSNSHFEARVKEQIAFAPTPPSDYMARDVHRGEIISFR
jgi:hypothetical protein